VCLIVRRARGWTKCGVQRMANPLANFLWLGLGLESLKLVQRGSRSAKRKGVNGSTNVWPTQYTPRCRPWLHYDHSSAGGVTLVRCGAAATQHEATSQLSAGMRWASRISAAGSGKLVWAFGAWKDHAPRVDRAPAFVQEAYMDGGVAWSMMWKIGCFFEMEYHSFPI
jgi:hypothetical protein